MDLQPADWEHKVEQEYTADEKAILAEGERIRELAKEGAFKLRRSRLLAELEEVEAVLEKLSKPKLKAVIAPAKTGSPKKAPEVAANSEKKQETKPTKK